MREIKFRAYHIGENKMYHDVCIMLCPHELRKYRVFSGSDNYYEMFLGNDKHFEIMQFTGLHDKNGKEIYEGDILKYIRTNMYCPSASFHNTDLVDNHEVYWSDDEHAFKVRTTNCNSCLSFTDQRADENIIEVIGNIYENPELTLQEYKKTKI